MEKATLNTCGIWIRLLFGEEVREEGQRRGRKGVVDKFGQGGVCSLWRYFVLFGDLFSRLVLWFYLMASVSS